MVLKGAAYYFRSVQVRTKIMRRDKKLDREIKTALHCMAYFRRTDSKCDYATLLCNTINIRGIICLDVTEAAGLYKGNRYFNTILLLTIHTYKHRHLDIYRSLQKVYLLFTFVKTKTDT